MQAKNLKVVDHTVAQDGIILSLKMIQSYAERVHDVLIHCVDSSQCDMDEAIDYTEFQDTITLINPEPSDILESLKEYSDQITFMVCYFD